MNNWMSCIGAVVLVTAATAVASAQAPAKPGTATTEPAQTTATYGDWVLGCSRMGEGTATVHNCVIVNAVVQQGQPQPVAQIVVGYLNNSGPLTITAVLPVAVSFAKVPQMVTAGAGSQVVKFTWRRCLPRGCFAEAPMTADLAKLLRSSAEPPQLTYQNAGERDVTLAVSLNGLPQALDALVSQTGKR